MNGAHRAAGPPTGPPRLLHPPRSAFAAAGAAALIVGLTLAAPGPAHAAVGPSAGGPCRAPLSSGEAVITRDTRWIGNGERRYWTVVTLTTTGDQYRLVVNRGVGSDPISGVVNRVQRGITGNIDAARSYGFSSRTKTVVAHVAGVDTITGRIFRIASC